MAAEKATQTIKALDRFYSEVIMGPGFVYLLGIAFFIFCLGLIVFALRFFVHHLIKLINSEDLNIAFSIAGFQVAELKNLERQNQDLIDKNNEIIESLKSKIEQQNESLTELIETSLVDLKGEINESINDLVINIEENLNTLDQRVLEVEDCCSDLDNRLDDAESELNSLKDGC